MNEHFVIQLLHKHYTGELDAKDRDLLLDWLQESPDNKSYGESIKEIWEHASNYSPKVDFESKTESAFQKFAANIRNETPNSAIVNPVEVIQPAKARRLSNIAWIIGIVACLIMLAGTFWMLSSSDNDLDPNLFATVSTISDQQEKINLVDNSTVWLNEKSTLKHFGEGHQNERKILLEGEGFFEVTKSDVPFVITTENATVTVLGTEFNVESDEGSTEVQVKSGKVELRPLNSNQSIELTANQIGVYDAVNKKLYRKQSKSYNGDSWKSGGFSFEDANLSEVFSTLEDYYEVEFELTDETLNQCVFTSPVYQNSKLEEVLSVMQVIYGFTYKYDDALGNKVIITGGKCSL